MSYTVRSSGTYTPTQARRIATSYLAAAGFTIGVLLIATALEVTYDLEHTFSVYYVFVEEYALLQSLAVYYPQVATGISLLSRTLVE